MRKLKLKGKIKLVNISSIKDTGDSISTKDAERQMVGYKNIASFTIKK